jgi:hypothetical protein
VDAQAEALDQHACGMKRPVMAALAGNGVRDLGEVSLCAGRDALAIVGALAIIRARAIVRGRDRKGGRSRRKLRRVTDYRPGITMLLNPGGQIQPKQRFRRW